MILFVAAMIEEARPIIQNLRLEHERSKPFETYVNKDFALIISNIGKINAAGATAYGIARFHPDAIYNIGLAGSIHPEMHYGDIIAVSRVYQHDSYLPFDDERFSYFREPLDLATLLERYREGILATGDSFVDNEELKKDIAKSAHLVDMEGHAVARIAHLHDVPVHMYKVISDNASDTAQNDFFENLEQMSHSKISELINTLFTFD
jgi:adenosylhomocysteine nucleosidase